MKSSEAVKRRAAHSVLGMSVEEVAGLLKSGQLTACILGLGRIGLPTATLFADSGILVAGVDIDERVVKETNLGQCRLTDEPGLEEILAKNVAEKRFNATLDAGPAVASSDFVIICVPTPVDETKAPNYGAVRAACHAVGRSLPKGSIVIIESTVGPGVVEDVLAPIIEEESGMKAGADFGIASCPERSDPGSIMKNMHSVPRIVGSTDPHCSDLVTTFYEDGLGVKVVRVSSPKTANAVKLTENLFRDVNIALANEFALLYEKFGIDTVEVINACATKYNFMPHYPGVGVGGPCLVGSEFVYLRHGDELEVTRIGDYVESLMRQLGIKENEINPSMPTIQPKDEVYALSMDGVRSSFNRVLWFSVRPYSGKVLTVRLTSNRQITVTPDHPMLVKTGEGVETRRASSLKLMDEVPLSLGYPVVDRSETTYAFDMIRALESSTEFKLNKVKVKPLGWELRANQKAFTAAFNEVGVSKSRRSDYYRWNYMPLDIFLKLERQEGLHLDRANVALYTSRGSACHVPALFKNDENFWRFIGYYLSEGCMYDEPTKHGATPKRIKVSFADDEFDLVNDCRSILESWGLKFNEEIRDGSHSLKFSSRLFGLMMEALGCGTDSSNKRLPARSFFLSRENLAALLEALLKGDGWMTEGRRDRRPLVGYASTSPELFHGVLLLLQRVGVIPTCRKIESRKSTVPADGLRIARYQDQVTLSKEVGGPTQLSSLLQTHPAMVKKSPAIMNYGTYATAYVKEVIESDFDGLVYNMEVEGTHTFTTSFGIVTHNCLPSNPYYLIVEGLRLGNIPYLIRLAREINDRMPDHVVELASEALNDVGKTVRGARVAVLGVAYKPGVRDVQLTPLEHVVKRLAQMGALIEVYDPMFSGEQVMNFHVHNSIESAVAGADCVIFGTAHKEFLKLDLHYLAKLMNPRPSMVDGRNIVEAGQARAAGFAFRGVGRVSPAQSSPPSPS